jgi:excisionase family DNA binding protein
LQAYTVEQVAKMLQISRDKVYYLLRTRQLSSIKIGKSRRITDRHLAAPTSKITPHETEIRAACGTRLGSCQWQPECRAGCP